jgi:hypothetical protein
MSTVFTGLDSNGNHWHVTRWSGFDLYVRFVKRNAKRKLLDQVAVWTSAGQWSADRWQPGQPAVPAEILQAVEGSLNDD